jgi:hypothetical protein
MQVAKIRSPGSDLPVVSSFKRSFERVTVNSFVAYYRVSTDKQGRFGLGMEPSARR